MLRGLSLCAQRLSQRDQVAENDDALLINVSSSALPDLLNNSLKLILIHAIAYPALGFPKYLPQGLTC
jgi:hypothetical protein